MAFNKPDAGSFPVRDAVLFAQDYTNGTLEPVTLVANGDGTFSVMVSTAGTNAPVVTNATNSGAINTTYNPSAAFYLENITVHLNAVPTTSENLVITLDANDGAAYDTTLFEEDLAAINEDNIVFSPNTPILCESGDKIVVTYTNTDANTYGLRIVTRLV